MTAKTLNMPFIRSPYNYDRDEASNESGLACTDKTLTQQSFKEESDINTIVDKFLRTGELPEHHMPPQYADFEGVFDFQSAMNTIRAAEESFAAMDAKVRYRFHNNPAEFLEFCGNPDNAEEMKKLGLTKPANIEPAVNQQGDTQHGRRNRQETEPTGREHNSPRADGMAQSTTTESRRDGGPEHTGGPQKGRGGD